jgi:hypothetical protein
MKSILPPSSRTKYPTAILPSPTLTLASSRGHGGREGLSAVELRASGNDICQTKCPRQRASHVIFSNRDRARHATCVQSLLFPKQPASQDNVHKSRGVREKRRVVPSLLRSWSFVVYAKMGCGKWGLRVATMPQQELGSFDDEEVVSIVLGKIL